jgi:hypothetical protein
MSSLLHGSRSHTLSTATSAGSRLVLHQVYCMGLGPILPVLLRSTGSRLVLRRVYYISLAPILPVLLCLLVHDWYYIEFTAWALFPYFQYYSVYWFTTCTTSSLLHGPCSHAFSTTSSTGSQLVWCRVYCMGLTPILPCNTLIFKLGV